MFDVAQILAGTIVASATFLLGGIGSLLRTGWEGRDLRRQEGLELELAVTHTQLAKDLSDLDKSLPTSDPRRFHLDRAQAHALLAQQYRERIDEQPRAGRRRGQAPGRWSLAWWLLIEPRTGSHSRWWVVGFYLWTAFWLPMLLMPEEWVFTDAELREDPELVVVWWQDLMTAAVLIAFAWAAVRFIISLRERRRRATTIDLSGAAEPLGQPSPDLEPST